MRSGHDHRDAERDGWDGDGTAKEKGRRTAPSTVGTGSRVGGTSGTANFYYYAERENEQKTKNKEENEALGAVPPSRRPTALRPRPERHESGTATPGWSASQPSQGVPFAVPVLDGSDGNSRAAAPHEPVSVAFWMTTKTTLETTDIYEAAYLQCLGFTMTVERRGPRCFFVFTSEFPGALPEARDAFFTGFGGLPSASDYANRIRSLKEVACGGSR